MRRRDSNTLGDKLDRAIALISPAAGVRRAQARNQMHVHQQFRMGANEAAETNRGNSDWVTMTGDADADTLDDLSLLRERSRDLMANDGRASGMVKTLVTSVIGTGIRPKPKLDHHLLGISPEKARETERLIETVFDIWQRNADASGRLDFYGLQQLNYRSKIVNGEYLNFPAMVQRPGRRFELCFHAIESDRLASPNSELSNPKIRGGVEVGDYGEPKFYHILAAHPGDEQNMFAHAEAFERVPAEDKFGHKLVIHEFDQLRPGQNRGLPAFSAIMNEFHDLDEYREAERYAMRLAACIGLIINDRDGDGAFSGLTTGPDGKKMNKFSPGMIGYGQGDLEVHQVNPQRPGNNFEAFIQDIERTMGVSQGIGYELARKDFTKSNYSSLRAAFVEARRYYKVQQADFVHFCCVPVYEWFLWEMHLKGIVDMPGFMENREFWANTQWQPMGFDWVDPEKEVKASVLAVKENLSTKAAEIARNNGGDYRNVVEVRGDEERQARAAGAGDLKTEGELDERLGRLGVPLSKVDFYGRYDRKAPRDDEDTLVPVGASAGQRQDNPGRRSTDQNDADQTTDGDEGD